MRVASGVHLFVNVRVNDVQTKTYYSRLKLILWRLVYTHAMAVAFRKWNWLRKKKSMSKKLKNFFHLFVQRVVEFTYHVVTSKMRLQIKCSITQTQYIIRLLRIRQMWNFHFESYFSGTIACNAFPSKVDRGRATWRNEKRLSSLQLPLQATASSPPDTHAQKIGSGTLLTFSSFFSPHHLTLRLMVLMSQYHTHNTRMHESCAAN